MAKSQKPTGLTITRSGSKFTCAWKFGEKNYSNGQEFHYSAQRGWNKSSVGVTDKQKAITFDMSVFYPYTTRKLTAFAFKVRGNARGKSWSDAATATMALGAPYTPTLEYELDSEVEFKSRFTWAASYSATDNRPFANVELQTMLLEDNPSNNGTTLDWSSATSYTVAASGYREFTEDLSTLAGKSYTRWVRVRARGCAGASNFKYGYITYAQPNKAVVTDAKAVRDGAGYEATVEWQQNMSPSRPIDNMEVQYAIEVPTTGLQCPSGATWTTARTVAGYNGTQRVSFPIDDLLDNDECLFVRVVSNHDADVSRSDPYLVEYGVLQDPIDLSVDSRSDETHRVTISATNESTIPDSRLAVVYMPQSNPDGYVVAVSTVGTGSKTISNIQCPDWDDEVSISFGVFAFVGDAVLNDSGFYDIDAVMRSEGIVSVGGLIPKAPTGVTVSNGGNNTVIITWNKSWDDANAAELSWADHEDAWQSTDEPDTYVVDGNYANWWKIAGLEAGRKWYFRVRLIKTSDDQTTYGAYSDTVSLNLSTAPETPMLVLSDEVTTDEFTCYWDYVSSDGTWQSFAEICEATVVGGVITYGDTIATAESESHITLSASELGWVSGTSHFLCVSLVSASGKRSAAWSNPVMITIAEKPSISIVNPFEVVTDSDRTYNVLTEMPLTVEVSGVGIGMNLTARIERAEYYRMQRPDGSEMDGYENEVVLIGTIDDNDEITLTLDDLIGSLDDGAKYRLVAVATDTYGQTATDSIEFEIHWEHQAIIPEATVMMYKNVARIMLIEPDGYEEGDTVDIYRLSADRPQLIYEGAEFGTEYVDPFPAIGKAGGHRLVYKTANGDYTTEDGLIAWLDLGEDDGDILESDKSIIDFGLEQIMLYYNQDFTSSWQKDFVYTSYLGGHVQGDWNPAVIREMSMNVITIPIMEQDTINSLRALAEYAGICHVRTIDGSSFVADIQVTESREHDAYQQLVSYELQTIRVDAQELDGMTFEDWAERYDHLVTPDLLSMGTPDGYTLSVDYGE